MPAHQMPGFRTSKAIHRGVEKNILITTWGGIGDQVCAEPTIRYALKEFASNNKVEVTLASHIPEVFRHLKFKRVFNLEQELPVFDNYLVFKTIAEQNDLSWQFINHCVINCVDYPAISAFRCQLPIKDREVKLYSEPVLLPVDRRIIIHPGKHWPTKTFPKSWWDSLIKLFVETGYMPIIIGKNMDDNRGTVDVDTSGCLDLRDKLDLNGLVYLLQNSHVVLTNDSSPIHIAASGRAFIGFVATCKHPDYITHWRNGAWSWRMKNFGRGGIWEHLDHLPNKGDEVTVDKCSPEQLMSWLPEPVDMFSWADEMVKVYKNEDMN